MKKVIFLLVSVLGVGFAYASSVPEKCEDVMMQGFYWNSYHVDTADYPTTIYGDTRWKTLYKQSSEIGAYFDIIWLPPSAYASGVGYHPKQYSNQNSDWGSRADLEALITAFHNQNTKVVADMVVNHIEAAAGWCDFMRQNFGEYGVFDPDASWICKTDEMNNPAYKKEANDCFGLATGAADDGYGPEANYDAARDWAHDQENVREMFRAYAKWMTNVMHYDGFRYDYCKGFHASHIDDYNQAGNAYISFMEMWSGNDDIIRNINDAKMNTMALDFQTKYAAFDGIAAFDYSRCKGSGLLGAGYAKYAVTFVDSHDWFYRDNGQEFGGNGKSMTPELQDRLLQANAFLLGMPGIPSVFYPHWAKYKDQIKPMIDCRHIAGVHSESAVIDEEAETGGYKATIVGKRGNLILALGNKAGADYAPYGYKKIAYGNGYAMWTNATAEHAPAVIVTPSATFKDAAAGINVVAVVRGTTGYGSKAVAYYTTDGTNPTLSSASFSGKKSFTFNQTTTLKIMGVCGNAQGKVLTYTYTYKEPQQTGIIVRFNKPDDWEGAYLYAWDKDNNNMLGAYPGQRIYQAQDGWYTYEFDKGLKEINFCINGGEEGKRSVDLFTDEDVCYKWNDADNVAEVMDCETELHPKFDLSIAPESSVFRDKKEGLDITINTVGDPNAMIYYTLDGSEPNTHSTNVQGITTFNIKQTTTVKAFAVKSQTEKTPVYTRVYTYKEPQTGAITVKFKQPAEWQKCYIYAFTRKKDGSTYKDTPFLVGDKGTKWPGKLWTTIDAQGWLTYTFPEKLNGEDLKEFYVIFNNGDREEIGDEAVQTKDLLVFEDVCYVWKWNDPEMTWGKAFVSPNCDGNIDEGIEQINIDDTKLNGEKILLDGHLYIIINNKMYNITGTQVK